MSDFTQTLQWKQVEQAGLTSLKLVLSGPAFATLQVSLDPTATSYDLTAPLSQMVHWELQANYGADPTQTMQTGDQQMGQYAAPTNLVVKFYDSILLTVQDLAAAGPVGEDPTLELQGTTLSGTFEVPYDSVYGGWILRIPQGNLVVTNTDTQEIEKTIPTTILIEINPSEDDDTLTYFGIGMSADAVDNQGFPGFPYPLYNANRVKLGYNGFTNNLNDGILATGGSAKIN